jgi:hypothetical protein
LQAIFPILKVQGNHQNYLIGVDLVLMFVSEDIEYGEKAGMINLLQKLCEK